MPADRERANSVILKSYSRLPSQPVKLKEKNQTEHFNYEIRSRSFTTVSFAVLSIYRKCSH